MHLSGRPNTCNRPAPAKTFIPKMAKIAALFENCHEVGHRLHAKASYIPEFWSEANLGVMHGEGGKPSPRC